MSQKVTGKQSSGGLLKSLTYGSGMLLLDGVNAVTPHWAGAVDIMAVRQRDGTIQSSPFYVRFGKYQSWSRRNRQVLVKVNGQLMDFTLELGSFGSAFFAHEQEQEVSPTAGDAASQEQAEMDPDNLGMMSPVAAYEANYMSMVAASSPDLPTSSHMGNSAMHDHHTSQSQPNPPPTLASRRLQQSHSARNNMHDSRDSSRTATPEATCDADLASGVSPEMHAHAVGRHASAIPEGSSNDTSSSSSLNPTSQLQSTEGPAAVWGEAANRKNSSQGGDVSKSEVIARRLPDVKSRESITNVFISSEECGEEVAKSSVLDSHAISTAVVSQPATPDWHALDRSCSGAGGPSLATVADSSFETAPAGSCEFFEDSQKLPEDLEVVAEELTGEDRDPLVLQRDGFVTPRTLETPDTTEDKTIQSHPVAAAAGDATAVCTSMQGDGALVGAALTSGATRAGLRGRGKWSSGGDITEGGREYSAMSSARSLATMAEEVGCNEREMVSPSRPLSRQGVDVQMTVEAVEGGEEHVNVVLTAWVRPVNLSFSATQLATIRTSLDQGPTSTSAVDATSGSTAAARSNMLARNNLIFHPNAQPQVQSPTMLGPDVLSSPHHERHVSFQAWEPTDALGNPTEGTYSPTHPHPLPFADDGEDAVLRASSPCAHRMQIGAEAMHGEEQENTQAEDLDPSSSGRGNVDRRMTANADTLRAAVAEEHEAEHGEHHDSYQGISPEVELAECVHLLVPDMPESALAQVFEDHRVHATDLVDQGLAALPLDRLAVRVGDNVYRYSDAQPLLLALLAFGGPAKQWQHLAPTSGDIYTLPPKPTPPEPKNMQRRRTWWASIFFGASSQEASKDVLAAGEHALLQKDLQQAPLSADGSAADYERFSTNAEEMQRAAGEMDRAEVGEMELGSGDTMERAMEPPAAEKRRRTVTVHSTHPTSTQLEAMAEHLQLGQNTVEFISGNQSVQSFIHLFNWNIRLVISDIDGTITRSDVLGHVLPPFGVDWSHPGVTRLFSNIAANGYQFVYLSSRSIAQSGITRAFLETLKQHDHGLPNGPVIISPHGIIPSLYREMILKRPQEFKMAALQGIRSLFPTDWNPFYCGFGNRSSDDVSYLHVGVPPQRIFTINPTGKVRQLSEPEPSERFDRLSKIDEQVDMIFPVTETARLRLFAQQVSIHSRTSQASTDAAVASGAAIAARATADAPGGSSPTAAANDTTQGTSATTAAASTASDDAAPPFSATGEQQHFEEGLSTVSSPSHSAAISIPPQRHTLESLRSLEGMQRFMSSSSTFGEMTMSSSPARGKSRAVPVDVDAREEFTDFNYWKMDGARVSAELEGLIAQEEAAQSLEASASGASPRPGTGGSSSGKKSGWGRR